MTMHDRKKILILGGTKHSIEAVKDARRKGFSPVVVDNIVHAPAKTFADQHFTFNLSDVKGLAKLAREEKIAGIFTAFENLNIWNAIALCKKADLPFYTGTEQSAFSMNNEKFMEICESFSVSVMSERPLLTGYETVSNASWGFAVILKTAVNSAGAEKV